MRHLKALDLNSNNQNISVLIILLSYLIQTTSLYLFLRSKCTLSQPKPGDGFYSLFHPIWVLYDLSWPLTDIDTDIDVLWTIPLKAHWAHWQAEVHSPPGQQGSLMCCGELGRQMPSLWILLLPSVFTSVLWYGTSPWSVGSCACTHEPPNASPVGQQKAEKALALCEPYSARTKTSLHYQPCFHCKSKTWPHTSYYEDN